MIDVRGSSSFLLLLLPSFVRSFLPFSSSQRPAPSRAREPGFSSSKTSLYPSFGSSLSLHPTDDLEPAFLPCYPFLSSSPLLVAHDGDSPFLQTQTFDHFIRQSRLRSSIAFAEIQLKRRRRDPINFRTRRRTDGRGDGFLRFAQGQGQFFYFIFYIYLSSRVTAR